MAGAYPREFRERAVALVREAGQPVSKVARELHISASCLAGWVAKAKVEAGETVGVSRQENSELVELRRRNRQLELEVEILKRASAYFARENMLPK